MGNVPVRVGNKRDGLVLLASALNPGPRNCLSAMFSVMKEIRQVF